MSIPPVTQNTNAYDVLHNPWGSGELPPGPPMPLDNPFVKSLERMFPKESSEELSGYASKLSDNMLGMLKSQMARDLRQARERARKMKEAL